MNRKTTVPIPEAIVQLQRQFDQFRSTQPRRTKLPESLWEAAVELAREHGIYSVAHPLRLDYMGLKKRIGGISAIRRRSTKAATFIELPAPQATAQRELSVRVRRTFGRGMGLNFGGISRLDSDKQLVPFLVLARFCRTSTGEVLIEQFHI